jgi:virginiamycin A acetyltransferase
MLQPPKTDPLPASRLPEMVGPSSQDDLMRQFVKSLADLAATLLVVPVWAAYRLGALTVGEQKSFSGFSQALCLLPGLMGVYLRRAFYKWVLPECGVGACITFGTVISHPTARIGKSVYTGAFCVLGDVTLEDDVLLGSHVSIINGGAQHGTSRLDIPVREQPGAFPRVRIGRDSWIGDRAVVMADVGKHAVVSAGAVVTKPVPDYAIVAGVPARVIRYREGAPTTLEERPGNESQRCSNLQVAMGGSSESAV